MVGRPGQSVGRSHRESEILWSGQIKRRCRSGKRVMVRNVRTIEVERRDRDLPALREVGEMIPPDLDAEIVIAVQIFRPLDVPSGLLHFIASAPGAILAPSVTQGLLAFAGLCCAASTKKVFGINIPSATHRRWRFAARARHDVRP